MTIAEPPHYDLIGIDALMNSIRGKLGDKMHEVGRFNLLCVGNTGAGKSTLINAVFGANAHTGIGRPVTQGTTEYRHPNLPLTVLDTRGMEIGEDRDAISLRLVDEITSRKDRPADEQIHVAWYCVRSTDGRLEDGQIEVIKAIQNAGVPVILVLTRVPRRDGSYHPDALAFATEIVAMDLTLAAEGRPYLTAALDDAWTGDEVHGLQDLLDATFRVAPEGVHAALTAAQQIDVSRKWDKSWAIIATASVAAGAAAASPIPFSDSALLVPIQIGMLAAITAAWGLNVSTSTLVTLIGSALLTNAATFAGRAIVAGLLKFIPIVGWAAGAVISGTVAIGMTTAIGAAYTTVTETLFKNTSMIPNLTPTEVREMFQEALRNYKGKPKAA